MLGASEEILVIKLGALGDFAMAMGPFKAIRAHHPDARITLLTTQSFAGLAQACGYFDEVWVDGRPKGFLRTVALLRRISWAGFSRIYDLQTSRRSTAYYHFVFPKPEWSGIACGCSHPHANPNRKGMHTIDQQTEQLGFAGIDQAPMDDFSWAKADLSRFDLPGRYGLVVPGGAAHRPAKRWPAPYYGLLAAQMAREGVVPVILGGAVEAKEAAEIVQRCPDAHNLVDQTSFEEIIVLARGAAFAVGNDTGPMHLIAMSGCPVLVLFSGDSSPSKSAPRGDKVKVLQEPDLANLDLSHVEKALGELREAAQ